MKPALKLHEGDSIVTAYATHESGPGWSNQPIWVIVRARNGTLREECIQPDDQTREMVAYFEFSDLANRNMTAAVIDAVAVAKKGTK